MEINNIEEIKLQKNETLTDNATNYELSKENVQEQNVKVFDYYDADKNTKLDKVEMSGLRSDIDLVNVTDKSNLSKDESKQFLDKIFPNDNNKPKQLYGFLSDVEKNYRNEISTKSDGVIDKFSQGRIGDCWLLSEVSALADTEWGASAIKESIVDDKENNRYQVNFKGVNFKTEITYDEIKDLRNSGKYSTGDIDMLLLEIGAQRYLQQEVDAGRMVREKNVLNGSQLAGNISAQKLLVGDTGNQFFYSPPSEKENAENIDVSKISNIDKFSIKDARDFTYNTYDKNDTKNLISELAKNPDLYAVTCNYREPKDWDNAKNYSRIQKNNKFENIKEHAYKVEEFIKDADGQVTTVVLENPWNSKVKIVKSIDDFLNQVLCIGVTTDLKNYENLRTGFEDSTWHDLDI